MGNRKTVLMNITVKTYCSAGYVCRPDTTWERESKDFFSPEYVRNILYSPVLFARISKAGKFISEKFVSRYYDGLNFGILLYPGNILEEKGLAQASVLDHTSILPFPLYGKEAIASAGNEFMFRKDGEVLFSVRTGEGTDLIAAMENCITESSMYVSQRIGDLVVVELAGPQLLMSENEKRAGISATFCDGTLFGLSIVR